MSQALLSALALSLLMTLAFEAGFFFLAGKRNKKDLLLVILVNILTNPTVVLLYWLAVLYTGLRGVIIVAPLEIFAILVEGYYYKGYGQDFKRPYIFSISANMFSYWLGVLIQFIIG